MNKVILFTENVIKNKCTFKLAKAWETLNAFFIQSEDKELESIKYLWYIISNNIYHFLLGVDNGKTLKQITTEELIERSDEYLTEISYILNSINIDNYLLTVANNIMNM